MIKIYTIENCPYCNKLKELLEKENIEFNDVNVDLTENEPEFRELIKITKSNNVPTIIVGKNILVADISFKTIVECIDLIKSVLNK